MQTPEAARDADVHRGDSARRAKELADVVETINDVLDEIRASKSDG